MQLTDTLITSPHVAACQIKDEMVLLDTKVGLYFGLNPVASRLWSLAAEEMSLADTCIIIGREFDVSRDRLEADIIALAAELSQRGLVIVRDGCTAAP